MNKIILGALLSTLALPVLATPVLAQSEPVEPVGPRVEARVGWDRPVVSVYYQDDAVTYRDSAGKSGVSYGGEIGYDTKMGQYTTIGFYAGIDGANTEECANFGTAASCFKTGRNFSAGVRVGQMLSPTTLLYAKGGYSNGRVRYVYDDIAAPEDNFATGFNRDGFHLGAGLEAGFAKGFYGKLEYVYTNYNGFEATNGTATAKLDLDRHQLVGGVGYRF